MDTKKFKTIRALLLVLVVFTFAGCGGGGGSLSFLNSLFGLSSTALVQNYNNPDDYNKGENTHSVPEPATMALLSGGMAAAFYLREKDKKK